MHYKLFMSTFSGTALDWFVSLPNGHITSFDQFSTLFREQFIVNQAPPPIYYDLFYVKQYQGELLKDFLNRFGALVVKLHTEDENMTVHAFKRGVLLGFFSDSRIRCRQKSSVRSDTKLSPTSLQKKRSQRSAEASTQSDLGELVTLSP